MYVFFQVLFFRFEKDNVKYYQIFTFNSDMIFIRTRAWTLEPTVPSLHTHTQTRAWAAGRKKKIQIKIIKTLL